MAESDPTRSPGALTPDEIVNRPFPTSFRGLAETEVRGWLARIAEYVATLRTRERDYEQRLQSLQQQVATPPTFTEQQLVAALGDETTRILRSAQEAAADIKRKADERAVHIVREAQDDAKRVRDEADRLLGARSLEAEEAGKQIVREAQARASEIRAEAAAELATAREKALRETANELVEAKEQAKQIVDEAGALRDKLVGDLGKRRTLLMAQIDELRAGRERLLDAYRTVKRTLDEATQALQSVEARAASELAGVAPRDEPPAPAGTPAPSASPRSAEQRPAPTPPRPPLRAAPLPTRVPTGTEGPAVRVLGPRPPEVAPVPAAETATPASSPAGVTIDAPAASPTPTVEPLPPAEPAPPVEQPVAPAATEPPLPEPLSPEPPLPELPLPEAAAALSPPPASTGDDIQAIFARIRAARDEALAEYATEPEAEAPPVETVEAVELALGEPNRDGPPGVGAPVAGGGGEMPSGTSAAATEPPSESNRAQEPVATPSADATDTERLLERRDASLDPLIASLLKRVKRALQDEQNNALDALRQHRGELTADVVLPGVHEQVAAYVAVAVDVVGEAFAAGVRSAGGDPDAVSGTGLGALIEDVARSVATPLRQRVAAGLSESVRLGEDENAVVERLNGRYREWKTQRLDAIVRDGLTAAFALGAYDATAPGEVLRWIVDDDGPCPDCDDNGLETTPRGLAFPTGHVHPPAHPGCRCFTVREPAGR